MKARRANREDQLKLIMECRSSGLSQTISYSSKSEMNARILRWVSLSHLRNSAMVESSPLNFQVMLSLSIEGFIWEIDLSVISCIRNNRHLYEWKS